MRKTTRSHVNRLYRKLGIGVAGAALALVLAAPATAGASDTPTAATTKVSSPAAAAPTFMAPFNCGKTFTAVTWSGHNPSGAVDWQSHGGDDVFKEAVKTSAQGTVTTVANMGNVGYGKYIVVTHPNGWSTLYAHLNSFDVKEGAKVGIGDTIAKAGNSGGSTGPHLHYEQRRDGAAVTPVVQGRQLEPDTQTPIESKNCA